MLGVLVALKAIGCRGCCYLLGLHVFMLADRDLELGVALVIAVNIYVL